MADPPGIPTARDAYEAAVRRARATYEAATAGTRATAAQRAYLAAIDELHATRGDEADWERLHERAHNLADLMVIEAGTTPSGSTKRGHHQPDVERWLELLGPRP